MEVAKAGTWWKGWGVGYFQCYCHSDGRAEAYILRCLNFNESQK